MNSLMVHLTKLEKILIVVIAILLLFVSSHFIMEHSYIKEQNQAPEFLEGIEANSKFQGNTISNKTDNTSTQIPPSVVVDIKGAVSKPGIYQLNSDGRVMDAIEKAGGITVDADLKQINLAMKLMDEMVIYVPFIGEDQAIIATVVNSTLASNTTLSSVNQGKVAINTATEAELSQLDGIGSVKAKAIVDYRTKYGKFTAIEQIMNVSGIGEKTFEKIKEKIVLH